MRHVVPNSTFSTPSDETGPVEILLEEPIEDRPCGKFETVTEVDETRLDYLIKLAKPVEGPRAKVRMWYANSVELRLHLDGDWGPGLGAIFIGEDGKLEINRDKIAASNKELWKSSDNPGSITKPETQYHIENWVECIKTRQRANADIEIGLRSTTLCYLVNIVREVGQVGTKLRWNPKTERFTNCDEANMTKQTSLVTFHDRAEKAMSSPSSREPNQGWEIPDGEAYARSTSPVLR